MNAGLTPSSFFLGVLLVGVTALQKPAAPQPTFSLPPALRSSADPEVLAIQIWRLPHESFVFWIEGPRSGCAGRDEPCPYGLFAVRS